MFCTVLILEFRTLLMGGGWGGGAPNESLCVKLSDNNEDRYLLIEILKYFSLFSSLVSLEIVIYYKVITSSERSEKECSGKETYVACKSYL